MVEAEVGADEARLGARDGAYSSGVPAVVRRCGHLSDPGGLTEAQQARTENDLRRMACMNVDWFSDRAFTCPESLEGTVETYKRLAVLDCHNAT